MLLLRFNSALENRSVLDIQISLLKYSNNRSLDHFGTSEKTSLTAFPSAELGLRREAELEFLTCRCCSLQEVQKLFQFLQNLDWPGSQIGTIDDVERLMGISVTIFPLDSQIP